MGERRYLPSFAELLDRLTIAQQKEILNPEHREVFTQEIQDILFDIGEMLKEDNIKPSSDFMRDLVILTIMNVWIWNNEDEIRKDYEGRELSEEEWAELGKRLFKTHQLNDLRSAAKNKIQKQINGRIDYKLNNVKAGNALRPSEY